MTGKYHVITTPRGYAVRCLLTGYIEAKTNSRGKAETICKQLNGGLSWD